MNRRDREWPCDALRTGPLAVFLFFILIASGTAQAQPEAARSIRWLTGPEADSASSKSPAGSTQPSLPACLRIRRVKQEAAHLSIYCSLLDSQGEPVTDVQPSDLQLSLDGRSLSADDIDLLAQRADEHLVVVLALGFTDTSKAALHVLTALSGAFVPELEEGKPDLCALLTFDGKVSVPRLFSSDPLLLKQSLSSIHFSGEGLEVNAAIVAARTLIHQHDTTGFGAVVLAGDLAGAATEGLEVQGPIGVREATPVFALTTAGPDAAHGEALAFLCTATRGEAFTTPADSLDVRTAVGRFIRILQRHYVIRVPGRPSGRLKLEYISGAPGSGPADSVMLAAIGPIPPAATPVASSRPRLVTMSLVVGAVLLALILALHAKSRTR